jgi:hypothetical protein
MSQKTVKKVIEEWMEVYAVDFKREGIPLPSYVRLYVDLYFEHDDDGGYEEVPKFYAIYFLDQHQEEMSIELIVDEAIEDYKNPLPLEDVIMNELEYQFELWHLLTYTNKNIPIYMGE